MERHGRVFSNDQMNTLRERVNQRKDTDEVCLLLFLLLETKLKMSELLGWFSKDSDRRKEYLKDKPELLSEYASAPKLFPKTHQAYLNRWKALCYHWFGVHSATFEMVRRSNKSNSKSKLTTNE